MKRLSPLILVGLIFIPIQSVANTDYKLRKEIIYDAVQRLCYKDPFSYTKMRHLKPALKTLRKCEQIKSSDISLMGFKLHMDLIDLGLLEALGLYETSETITPLNSIARTQTLLGCAQLAIMIAQPLSAPPEWTSVFYQKIQKRQSFIKYLIEHDSLRKEFSEKLEQVKHDEESGLAFLNYPYYYPMLYQTEAILKPRVGLLQYYQDPPPWTIQLNGMLGEKSLILSSLRVFAESVFGLYSLLFLWKCIQSKYRNTPIQSPGLKAPVIYSTLNVILYALLFPHFRKAAEAYDQYIFMFSKPLAHMLRASKYFQESLSSIDQEAFPEELSDKMNALMETGNTFEESKLYQLAHHSAFDKEHCHKLFDNFGVVRCFARLVGRHKELLKFHACFIAEVDAYLSISKLLTEPSSNNSFCFSEFSSTSSQPIIEGKNFWSIANRSEAVPVSLTRDLKEIQNMIATEPYGRGPSSTIGAILFNIMLSQSFGIAAAESWKMTPFTSIIPSHHFR